MIELVSIDELARAEQDDGIYDKVPAPTSTTTERNSQ